MSLRSRSATVPVAKVFGPGVPPAIEAAEARAQMTPASPFSPGEPIGPYDGFSRTPRSHNFVTSSNTSTRPRTHARISFETLKGLINNYDVAQLCIRHRIASLRSLDWKLIAADDYTGDVSEAIALGKKVLKRPDRKTLFRPWLAKWLRGILSYDAGTLYRMRNRAGRPIGLKVLDGTLIAPMLDYWGDSPDAPATAYVQYVNGLPWDWLTRDDIIYEPYDPQDDSIYGRAPLEDILLNANTDIRFQVYFLQRFTEGNLPAAFASAPESWTPDQIEQFQEYWDGFVYGDQSRKHQIRWIPGGSSFAWSDEKEFTDHFSLFLMRKTCLDEETEILTRRGWVHFPKLIDGDEVATRSEDGRFEWQKPTDYIAKPHAGDMVQFKSNSLDLLVTPDHRMLLTYFPTKKHPHPKEFIKTAGEIVGKGGYMIPMRSHWEGESPEEFVLPGLSYENPDKGRKSSHTVVRPDLAIPMRTWMAFLGLWLAEGHAHGTKGGSAEKPGKYRVGISQSDNSPYFGEIQELLDSLPFTWVRHGHTWTCQDMRLHAYLAPLGNSYTKHIPEDVKNLSPDLLEILWAWACRGDGHHYLGKFWHMITASERLAGDWQEVLQKLGRDASVSRRKPSDGGSIRGKQVENCRETWIVRERTSPLRTAHGEMVSYEGMVYCVTVPNGVIYVRRNGRPAWVGNCAAYAVVPSDLGFTESVNRSSGESQADVQHRVGDLPMAHHIQDILSAFLQDDLQLPLRFAFDLGEEQDDRVDQATADDKYMKMGVVGPSEIREMRYGLTDPEPIPRFIYTERAGPIPISSLLAVAGTIDPATELPEPGADLPHTVFGGTEGVLPNPPIRVMSLAEQEYGPSAMPPAPPPQPKMTPADEPVAKEGEGAPAAGITADTGIYSYDLAGRDDDEDEAVARRRSLPAGYAVAEDVAKSEMAAFRRYARARRKAGLWRDFRFTEADPVTAHRLNDEGRLSVRKAAGEVAVAGLAVLAADTGRVLMLQRGFDPSDPASGAWEMPGGHIEDGEQPYAAACREWQEETGCLLPHGGGACGSWLSSNGIYQGFVYVVPAEASVPIFERGQVTNPDDPDADQVEAIAWWAPDLLPGNPAIRAELAADIDTVMSALAVVSPDADDEPATSVAKCSFCTYCGGDLDDAGMCMDWLDYGERTRQSLGIDGTQGDAQDVPHRFCGDRHDACAVCGLAPREHADRVAKAGDARPKGPKGWPGWKLDLRTAAHWAPAVTAAAQRALPADRLHGIATGYIADHPDQDGGAPGKRDRNAAALSWLRGRSVAVPMNDPAAGITADSVLIGGASAQAAVAGKSDADTNGWTPGDTEAAKAAAEALGLAALLASFGGGSGDLPDIAGDMGDGYLNVVSRVLAGWSPDVAAAELGDMLETAVADGAYAEALTVTQITTVAGQAALSLYLTQNGMLLAWVIEDAKACRACITNSGSDPRPAGIPWPSGDEAPPAHPNCRCALIPSGAYVAGPEG